VDEDDQKRFSYCGCDVRDGQLRVLFSEGKLGTNIYDAVSPDNLMKALNDAPPAAGADSELSFRVRTAIRQDWDPEIEAARAKAAEMLQRADLKFEPRWAENFEALKHAAGQKNSPLGDDWEGRMAYLVRLYFEGLVGQLSYQKFGDDDMLREGFNDEVAKGVVVFRVLEKMKFETYCECEIDDGVLYLQVSDFSCTSGRCVEANLDKTVPQYFGTNVDDAARKLMDKL
jgi:hypothetical protein